MTNGIDVSRHQGVIDWNKVKQSGVDFAMIRAGYGKYESQKDPKFDENYQNARKAGIKVGAYYYSYAKSVEDAKKEAEVFLKIIKGKQFEMPVAFDVEEKSQSDKGKAFVSDVIRAFCERVERAGYFVSVYANKYWLEHYIDDDCKRKYDIWLAHWAAQTDYNGRYGMWQNSSKGRIQGISGNCDTDKAYKDYPKIMREYGLNGFKKSGASSGSGSITLAAGTMVSLHNTPVYISATIKKPALRLTGTYYVYDGIDMNSRLRITNTLSRVGKKPVSDNVTGYVNISDIK